MTVDPSRWPRYAIFHLHALLAQLHRQRRDHERRIEPAALSVSTTAGKSVKRSDSKRVVAARFSTRSR